MKLQFILLMLISLQSCAQEQNDPIILKEYIGGDPFMEFFDAQVEVAKNWGFTIEYFYGDCAGTYDYKIAEFKKYNRRAYKLLSKIYGKDWKTRFDIDVELLLLASIKGDEYTQKRTRFLKDQHLSASKPENIESVHYKIQYAILRAWETDSQLFDTILEDLRNLDVPFHSVSRSGFYSVYDDFRMEAHFYWQEKGLPIAWEAILKYNETLPSWQIATYLNIIEGFPHEGSIGPLLIYISGNGDRSLKQLGADILKLMPKEGLRKRLNSDTIFYEQMRPLLEAALKE